MCGAGRSGKPRRVLMPAALQSAAVASTKGTVCTREREMARRDAGASPCRLHPQRRRTSHAR